MKNRRTVTCIRCHKTGLHAGRGLCRPCHQHLSAFGGLDAYPAQPRRSLAEAGQAIEALASEGASLTEIAARLGYQDRWVIANTRYKARRAQLASAALGVADAQPQ